MSEKVAIRTPRAPRPAATYSQAIRKGAILQVAGQIPTDPESGVIVGTTVAEQTRRVLDNIAAILDEAGASFDDVVMTRVYLTRKEHFAAMDAVYAEIVPEPYPARTTVFTGLVGALLVEIDALAVMD
jgi:2-iminobutanoate/2-iminopropanoate deaminase